MKTTTTLHLIFMVISLTFLSSCAEKEVKLDSLIERDGLMYEVNTEKPYSGKVFSQYENQQFKTIGYYDKGLQMSTWQNYRENGQLKSTIQYVEGKFDGQVEVFNEQNVLTTITQYKNGERHGVYKKYLEDGTILEEGEYKNDKQDGLKKGYSKGKLFYQENYTNGEKNGEAIYYDNEGKLYETGRFGDNKRTGNWVSYFDGTKVSAENFYNDNQITKQKLWYKNGKVKYEASYPGLATWYDEKGTKVAEANLQNKNSFADVSSLKVMMNGTLVSPYSVLNNSIWGGTKQNLNMKYQNTRKENYQHRLQFNNGEYRRWEYFRNGYGRTMTGLVNNGTYRPVVTDLPKLNLLVVPFPSPCRGCKQEYLSITSLSNDKITINGKTYHKRSVLYDNDL